MASIYAKIIYPSSVLSPTYPVTLTFQFPARKQTFWDVNFVRHDNVASSGVRETVYERRDAFLEFDMPYIASGYDAAGWQDFLESAGQGIPFDFYPDSSDSGTFTTYTLENTSAKLDWVSPGLWQLPGLKFRERVAWP
jgi:hypothetical protein